jgi:trypsin
MYYTVVVNQYNIYVAEGSERKYSVSRIVRHPNYNDVTLEHDIALMKVSSPIVLDEWAQTIRIPDVSEAPAEGDLATVTGWGVTRENGTSLPLYLHYVSVPIVTREKCNENYAEDGLPIYKGMLCAGQTVGGKDSCNGDSGGPLVCPSNLGNYLCGIVSWGVGCARPGKPGVYTEVAYYSQWIQTTIVT